ncbi:MAG: serine hydrolase [Melioribacteraceae bacterium]|nr:serine hydrolase [Melioribacteraceae bacterium]
MKYLLRLFILLPMVISNSCGDNMDINQLKLNILAKIPDNNGNYAIAFIDLKTGEELMINEKVNMHAASTMKTPVMIEVFKQAVEGKFNLQDSILVKNEFRSIIDGSIYSMDIGEDSGDSLYQSLDKKQSIYQLVYEMITVSSNLATNILIDIVGADNIMQTMKQIGANDIQVLRGVEDIKAYRLGKNNTTTAYDLAVILKAIAEKNIINPGACDQMITVLSEQKFNDIIPELLPENTIVAHKTGSITGVKHDSAIIYLPNGHSYILVLLSSGVADDEKGKKLQQEISKEIYDYVVSQ